MSAQVTKLVRPEAKESVVRQLSPGNELRIERASDARRQGDEFAVLGALFRAASVWEAVDPLEIPTGTCARI